MSMKRWMWLLGVLLAAPVATQAAIDELSLRFTPDVTEMPDVYLHAFGWSNSARAEYRAEVFRREGDAWLAMDPDTVWLFVQKTSGEVFVEPSVPGEYRLVLHASEGPGTPERSVARRFRYLEGGVWPPNPELEVAWDRYRIAGAYEYTRDCWQDQIAMLRRMKFLMLEQSWEFAELWSGRLDVRWCTPEDPNQDGAPGGGERIIYGQPGDGDATGAVVVTDLSAPAWPTSLEELSQFGLAITLPAWAGVPDLVRRTEVVAWEPGIVDPDTLISNLSLRVHPAGDLFALDGSPIPMWATVDGGKASFAYELARWDGAAWQHEEAWQGSSQVRWQPRRAGQYRVRVTASEEGAPTVLQRTRTFRVLGPRHPDFARVSAQNRVDRNFEVAMAYVRNGLYSAKRGMMRWGLVTDEFSNFQIGHSLAEALAWGWGGGHLTAPGGGPAVIGGVAGDGDATGAIVLEVLAAPAAEDNWEDTTVRIHYPAYAPAGTQRRSVDVRYR